MQLGKIENIVEEIGGKFYSPASFIQAKLKHLQGLVFDWDGVFTNGKKDSKANSFYSEADSMGINMFRFSYWLKTNKILPIAIISGESNETAHFLAKREHFNLIITSATNKSIAVRKVVEGWNAIPTEIACFFDDINDIPLVTGLGLRFMIRRNSSAFFRSFCELQEYIDYYTSAEGGNHAVREVMEMLIFMMKNEIDVINYRAAHDYQYQKYLKARNAIETKVLSGEEEF